MTGAHEGCALGEKIAELAAANLNPNGQLFFEINPHYAEELIKLLEENGLQGEVKQDMQGKKRMIRAWHD